MIDICILSCNRSRITQLAITEIQKRTLMPHRLIVMDNGSTDGSEVVLEAMLEDGLIDQLILLDENTGVHFGFNRLLELVQSEPYYICSDADLIPCVPIEGQDWLIRLISLIDRHPEYGAVACRPHILIGEPGDRFKDSPEIREMSHIGAHLRIMKTDLVRIVGGWKNVKAPSRNNEDWHIGGLIRKAGFKVGYSRDIRTIHLFGDPLRGEDPWGYPEGVEHGHVARWPPVHHFAFDRIGIDWESCKKED